MKVVKIVLLALLAAGCAATPPPATGAQPAQRTARTMPPPPPADARPAIGPEEAQALTQALFSDFHERIVEAEEHRSGPGAVLTHITLYERPQTTHLQGLCEVTVHDVGVPFTPPPQDPPRTATWVRTGTRYYAIGDVGPSIPPADQERGCASLPTARTFFTAPSRERALLAMQMFTDARRWAARDPRAVRISCTSFSRPCGDPAGLMARLHPRLVTAISEQPCQPEGTDAAVRPERQSTCFIYALRDPETNLATQSWSVKIRGPARPVAVEIRQDMPPVS